METLFSKKADDTLNLEYMMGSKIVVVLSLTIFYNTHNGPHIQLEGGNIKGELLEQLGRKLLR